MVYRVERLDHPGLWYWLVVFSDRGDAIALAILDGVNGRLESWARTTTGKPIALTAEEALQLAYAPADSNAELVWGPCRASRSPYYPLWAVRTKEGRTRYVDQQRNVWDAL